MGTLSGKGNKRKQKEALCPEVSTRGCAGYEELGECGSID